MSMEKLFLSGILTVRNFLKSLFHVRKEVNIRITINADLKLLVYEYISPAHSIPSLVLFSFSISMFCCCLLKVMCQLLGPHQRCYIASKIVLFARSINVFHIELNEKIHRYGPEIKPENVIGSDILKMARRTLTIVQHYINEVPIE